MKKKLLSALLLSALALAACTGESTEGNPNANSNGENKFAQAVKKNEIAEDDKIENKTALAKELSQVYINLLTDKSLLEGDALDTYIAENFDVEDPAALKAKAQEYLAVDYTSSFTVISVTQTEADILKSTTKVTFKTADDSKSSNATIFIRVSDDGNKITEIKGH